jgi:4a-hydroxytetrahydrobiopterin dehydratase
MKIIITEKQNKMVKNKDNWEKVGKRLIKTFYFEDYKGVIPFVKEVMKIADKQNHHPDMTVHYDNVKLSITDHEKGGVSEKCHKFAKAVDDIL